MSGEEQELAATRDALKRIEAAGNEMRGVMELDFLVSVPNSDCGELVAMEANGFGFAAKVELDEESGKWTCTCSKSMVPELEAVRKTEMTLSSIAKRHGARLDGFDSVGNAYLKETFDSAGNADLKETFIRVDNANLKKS